ncbi:MAG: hypothetical protein LBV17_03860 [Treponema sp.]|jgi:hypothetical protein|nr:hypothetical protein [Treponema sp.]
MKRKMQKILLCIGILIFVAACDMVRVDDVIPGQDSNGRQISEKERDELEKTGHFLKLINMPLNTQTPNVFSVSVANSATAVGKLNNDNTVFIFKETDTCTVYLPLVYNDETEFWETGFFYTAFTIHVDAVTKYIVSVTDKFLVSYTDGRGTADVTRLPFASIAVSEPRYLTVFNLPSSVSIHNFAKVAVHNQTGAIASCKDYSEVVISLSDNKATAKIPLLYNSVSQIFSETGVFIVVFDINVDAETRYTVVLDDQVKVTFINGNGYIDILNIPDKPVPYLTIKELPLNATKFHISDVNVYNLVSSVASCDNYNKIIVLKEKDYLTFLIPLSSLNGGYFQDSGRFSVSFTVNVDIDTQFIYTKSDNLILPFTNGSAEFGIRSFYGLFEASLTNPSDFSRPEIKAGSVFDVNGNKITVKNNYLVDSIAPNTSCFIYLYAYMADMEVVYEFSTNEPTYNDKKNGWYKGTKRALWKMIYLNSSEQFLFKTYVEDDFPQMGKNVLTNSNDFSQLVKSKPAPNSLNGANNPDVQLIQLNPGLYAVELKGAGGGKDASEEPNYGGGSGGLIREIITLNSPTSFYIFTGSGGQKGNYASTSGEFAIIVTRTTYDYSDWKSPSQTPPTGTSTNTTTPTVPVTLGGQYIQSLIPLVILDLNGSTYPGLSGSGGGSGTFLFCPEEKYLLVAGGGGGCGGASRFTPGGGGGSGGTIGPGSAGGASGFFSQTIDTRYVASGTSTGRYNSPTAGGGQGGGKNAGASTSSGILSLLPSTTTLSGGAGAINYYECTLPSSIPNLWKTTKFGFTTNYVSLTVDNKDNIQQSTKIVGIRSGYNSSSGSSGGSVAQIYYQSPDPSSWKNTSNVGGKGANAPTMDSTYLYGTVSTKTNQPGTYGKTNFTVESSLQFHTGTVKNSNKGQDGGNNRNSVRGGGASQGEAGSITIYKIY